MTTFIEEFTKNKQNISEQQLNSLNGLNKKLSNLIDDFNQSQIYETLLAIYEKHKLDSAEKIITLLSRLLTILNEIKASSMATFNFIDGQEPYNFSPFIGLDNLDTDQLINYDGNELSLNSIEQCTFDNKPMHLYQNSGGTLYYYPDEFDVNDNLTLPNIGDTCKMIQDHSIVEVNLNFDLLNEYLSYCYLLNNNPELFNLKQTYQEHFSKIANLPTCWLNAKGVRLLNLIDDEVICADIITDLQTINPETDSGHRTFLQQYANNLLILSVIFESTFPGKPLPQQISEYKELLNNNEFLQAIIVQHPELLDHDELFTVEQITSLALSADDQTLEKIIPMLTTSKVIHIILTANKEKNTSLIQKVINNIPSQDIKLWFTISTALAYNTNASSLFETLRNKINQLASANQIKVICLLFADKSFQKSQLEKDIIRNKFLSIFDCYQLLNNKSEEYKYRLGASTYIQISRWHYAKKNHLSIDEKSDDLVKKSLSKNIKHGITKNLSFTTKTQSLKSAYSNIVQQITLGDFNTADVLDEINHGLEQARSIKNKLSFFDFKSLSAAIHFETKLHSLKEQVENIQQTLSNLSNKQIYSALLNPNIYSKLTSEELTLFFKSADPIICAQIIVEFHANKNYKSFSLRSGVLITYDKLAKIVSLSRDKKVNLDEFNERLYNTGFPIIIPKGSVYTGVNYVSKVPLPACIACL